MMATPKDNDDSDYRLVRIGRQFTIFTGVGLVVIAVHYGMLVALVESGLFEPVKATCVYVAGGIV